MKIKMPNSYLGVLLLIVCVCSLHTAFASLWFFRPQLQSFRPFHHYHHPYYTTTTTTTTTTPTTTTTTVAPNITTPAPVQISAGFVSGQTFNSSLYQPQFGFGGGYGGLGGGPLGGLAQPPGSGFPFFGSGSGFPFFGGLARPGGGSLFNLGGSGQGYPIIGGLASPSGRR